MRVVKRLYSDDDISAKVSGAFDEVLLSAEVPLNFEELEFNVGYGATSLDEEKAVIGIDTEDKIFANADKRIIKTLITMELYRVFVRKRAGRALPPPIEDVVIGRDMIRNGHSEDLNYLFYTFVMSHRVTNIKDFLRLNMPWIIFHGFDENYSSMLKEAAKTHIRYKHEIKLKNFFESLKKDLWEEKNLEKAIKLYGAVINAGDQIQMEHGKQK